jgi:hypothetical protein
VHELIAVDDQPHVRRAAGNGLKKNKITGMELVEIDFFPHAELVANLARQPEPELCEDVLDEAAAVEP